MSAQEMNDDLQGTSLAPWVRIFEYLDGKDAARIHMTTACRAGPWTVGAMDQALTNRLTEKNEPIINNTEEGVVVSLARLAYVVENGLRVRTNGGVYRCKGEGGASSPFVSYLRFYPNGDVIKVSSGGTPHQISGYFNRTTRNKNPAARPFGKFRTFNDLTEISFTTNCSYGSVDYNGHVRLSDGLLCLNSHSRISGHRSHGNMYEFVQVPTWKENADDPDE